MDYTDRYIRFDWAVKRLLRNKANFGVLGGFPHSAAERTDTHRRDTGK